MHRAEFEKNQFKNIGLHVKNPKTKHVFEQLRRTSDFSLVLLIDLWINLPL